MKESTFCIIVLFLAIIVLSSVAGAAPVARFAFDRVTLTGTSTELNGSGVTYEVPDNIALVSISYGYSTSETSTQTVTVDCGEGSGYDYAIAAPTPSSSTSSFVSFGKDEVILIHKTSSRKGVSDILKFTASGCDSNLVSIAITFRKIEWK